MKAMKAILDWFKNFFEGPLGESSSKRLVAFVCLAASIYSGLVNKDTATTAVYLSTTGLLLGVSAITRS